MNRVYELRDKFSMTQEGFAEFCGISRSSIARYENGGEINRVNAKKIADACNVTIGYVLCEEKKPAAESGGQKGRLNSLIDRLEPDEYQRVADFVSGILSSRKE